MSSRVNCNTYIINGVVEIRSYQAYLNYYFEVLKPAGLTTICSRVEDRRGRMCFHLRTIERARV